MASRVGLNREQVFAVALRMADESGLHDLTIAALAARLGIQRQSIYAHVGNRDALLQDIRIHHFGTLAGLLTAATARCDRAEAVRALVTVSVSYELEHRGAFTTTGSPPGPDEAELWAATKNVMQPVFDVLAAYGVTGDASTVWFRAFWAMVVGYTTLATGPRWGPVPAEATLEALIASLTGGLEGQRDRTTDEDAGAGPSSRRGRR